MMTHKHNHRLLMLTLINLSICLISLYGLFAPKTYLLAQPAPPNDFLNPIYYGSNNVSAVFDHWFPYLSLGQQDPNDCTQHYDGTLCNDDPPDGYGYDRHDGIDYDLNYEPVLAAANGIVDEAGWANSSDHTDGLGLYARIEHENDYVTEYGHLSALQVQVGDQIEVDPDNRHGLVGMSGNTGNSTGSHLHFGLKNPNSVRVNPYGWIGAPGTDPWELAADGAPSHDVWVEYPSISTDQFDDGDAINDPGVNNARMIIDDGSADFVTSGPCTWSTISGINEAYNNAYRRIITGISEACMATWHIKHDAFTPAGEYDLFVHIPQDVDASLGVEYTVQHNGESAVAVIAQAAYVDNNEHDAWAYLGRYDFAMNSAMNEFVRLDSQTIISDSATYVLADAIMLAPAGEEAPPPQRYLYVSFASSGYAGNIPYENEDILLFDAATGEWRMFLDGSDVGLSSVDVDAVAFRDSYLYFSLDASFGNFTDTDIIRFNPTSLGEDTSGTMNRHITGAKVGLTEPGEDVDALTFNYQGNIVVSVTGQAQIGTATFEDEDLFVALGPESAGMFFDGSSQQLLEATENVDGAWLGANGRIYLSTTGSFAVTGVSGDGADIFVCAPGFIQNCLYDPGLFWNSSAHGLGNPSTNVDDFFVHENQLLENCEIFTNGGFEAEFYCWSIVLAPDPQNQYWLPTINEANSGWHSAMAVITSTVPDTTRLRSSPTLIQPIGLEYRFSFYGKAFSTRPQSRVSGILFWYDDDVYLSPISIGEVWGIHSNWALFATPFECPPPSANRAIFTFFIYDGAFTQEDGKSLEDVDYFFIDDVQVESRPNASCPTLNSGGN